MKIEGDQMVFSSGRKVYANRGVVGLTPDLEELTEGYDGHIDFLDVGIGTEAHLSKAELLELADAMIERWQAFKAKVQGEKP